MPNRALLVARVLSMGFLLVPDLVSLQAQPLVRQIHAATDPGQAVLSVHAGERSAYPIPAELTGKFAEHLYYNIVNGMDALILRNPTFAEFPFSTGNTTPDGVMKFMVDEQGIARSLRNLASSFGWPADELDDLVAARADGLASLWSRVGARAEVSVSPDTGPYGGRAQRVETRAANQGVAQWMYLPLHRVRRYDFEVLARSPEVKELRISLTAPDGKNACAAAPIRMLGPDWRKFTGSLEVPADLPADKAYKLAITTGSPGQWVIRHALLRPADHIHGADPDIIRMLKASHLPLLRWPGGNFVSGYHWEEGVGPIEQRPSRPNYAWGQVEPNLFGTDEFIAFCRGVGCEPMICVNAGSGTPEEAARWIEYCNGPISSPMGARRAANGHPQAYGVKYWEVGNELWGRWQFNWTTASGYVDRYKLFSAAMLKADPSIRLQACGAPVFWGKTWNDTLVAGLGPELPTITDHPLIGGGVPATTDPLDVYRDFMAVPEVLEEKWAGLRKDMVAAGVKEPRLAVTELQMFANISGGHSGGAADRLTHETLVRPQTLAEGLYDVLIYHAAVRLAPFVEMVTHSAVVNHGGGLQKSRERVFAQPCYYAQAAFAAFAGATPVAAGLGSAIEEAPRVLPQLRDATSSATFSALDALAAVGKDGSLLISLVNRRGQGAIHLEVAIDGFNAGKTAQVHTLAADVPWATNTPENPERVKPADSVAEVSDGKLRLDLAPYTLVQVRIPRT